MAPGNEHLIGAPHHHNSKHIVDEGWFPDHCVAGASNGHSWVEGLLDYWLLTGDAPRRPRAMRRVRYSWTVEDNATARAGRSAGRLDAHRALGPILRHRRRALQTR